MSRIPALGPRGEGWVALQAVLLVAIPVAAWLASMTPLVETPAIALAREIGAAALLAAVAIIGVSLGYLRGARALSALPRPLETAELVEAGPYRFVRHPIYGGLVLAGIAVALIRASLPVALLTLALAVVLDVKRRREEAWLVDRYPGYVDYRARTRALIPFLY